DLFLFDRVHVHEDVEQRGLRTGPTLLDASQDAVHDDPFSRRDATREVVLQVEGEPLGLLAPAQAFGRLLDLEFLRVDEEGRFCEELELRRARGTLASALFLVALERLAEGLPVLRFFDDRPASEALEQGVRDPRTDLRRFAHEAFNRDVLSEVLRPKGANRDPSVPWEELDPEMDLRTFVPRRGGSLGNGHIPLRLPSTDARPMREFRSDRFHWNPNGSGRLTRRARSRTLDIARSRPRGRGSRRSRDTSSRAFDLRRRQNVRD